MPIPELQLKARRLNDFLDRHELDGVLLQQRNNFAWITGGRDNHITNSTPAGVAAILATRDSRVCLANTIEAPRFKAEELAGMGIDVISFPWYDGAAGKKVAQEVIGGRKIATDNNDFGLGLPRLPGDFAELRFSLCDEEIARYRDGGARATTAMEKACREINLHDTEHEIAGVLDYHIHRSGCNPLVTLVASDERIERYRHPIPTDKKVNHYVMLVTCAEFKGLISCLTRFVAFTPPSAELIAKQQTVCNVDTVINYSTRPGMTLGQLFTILEKAYADNGHADQWKVHHQGGPTGYAPREGLATPGGTMTVRENQAFAWNPSITGVKSEDTVLITPRGTEVLTAASEDWPKVTVHFQGQTYARPNILPRYLGNLEPD